MTELGHNPTGYALNKLVDNQITTTCLQNYLDEKTELGSDRLELILEKLGLKDFIWL